MTHSAPRHTPRGARWVPLKSWAHLFRDPVVSTERYGDVFDTLM